VTLTAVGYGDLAPETPFGKVLASAVMLMGYGVHCKFCGAGL
jgi:voltage-gated potassium channel